MTPKQKAMKLAEELGATVEAEKDDTGFCIKIEAPEGYHWSDGIHELVNWQFSGFKTADLWNDMLDRMTDGIEKCNNECEWWG